MSDTEVYGNTRALLQSSQPEEALALLSRLAQNHQDDVMFLQLFGEVLLENNSMEAAYDVLFKACGLDPEAAQGTEKFLYLGQIIGGADGVRYLETGISKLAMQEKLVADGLGETDPVLVSLAPLYPSTAQLCRYLVRKLILGIFAQIEIWMTDLCMEPEAEEQCNSLIERALEWDANLPETWLLLGSIRISQQREQDAQKAIQQSWSLFQNYKKSLEEPQSEPQGESLNKESDAFELGIAFTELLQPLLTLAKLAIEVELYEIAASICYAALDIHDNSLETYYYGALAHLFHAQKLYGDTNKSDVQDYRDINPELLLTASDAEIASLVSEAKTSLTGAYRVMNTDGADIDESSEITEHIQALLGALGGPVMSELMPQRVTDEDGWDAEIVLDDE